MERLTNSGTKEAKSNVTIKEVVDKLAEYEDAEEQGLLIRLPCKVGDTVSIKAACECVVTNYDKETNTSDCPFEADCEFEECNNGNERLFTTIIENNGHGWYMCLKGIAIEIPVHHIGKTVFIMFNKRNRSGKGL